MTHQVTRRFLLGGLSAATIYGAAYAGAPLTSLRPRQRGEDMRRQAFGGPEAVFKKSGLSGDAAFAVADVETGLVLEAYQGSTALPPASVTKTMTALYALNTLGPNHRYRTRIVGTGALNNGILQGDLILAGGGDPLLDTTMLAKLAGQLKAAGVREVRGAFKVYDGALPTIASIDPDQPDHVGYNPTISGMALNFNRVHFEWKRAGNGYAVAMDARTKEYRPDVSMAKMKVINRQLPVYTYEDRNGVDNWTVASKALGNGGARWLPVRRPADYAGDVFRTMARVNGIVLKKAVSVRTLPAQARVLAQHESLPLHVILKDMMKYSNNLTAEMVGLSATVARGKMPSSLKASAQEMNRWAQQAYGTKASRYVDHSGLGDASRTTPQDLLAVLVAARKTGVLRPLMKKVPMRDTNGRVVSGHPIKVDAKTGTLNFVSGLGGFMTAADGTELAFAIFSADTTIRARIKKADREVPQGARAWNRKAKKMQQALIERWGALYGS